MISDQDLNIFLEAIIQSAPLLELCEIQRITIALLYAVMSPEQRYNFQEAHWYLDGVDNIVRSLEGRDEPRDRVIDRVHELLNQPIEIMD